MTSNIGSQLIRESFENLTPQNHDEVVEKTKNEVMNMLKKIVRPEFLNRIDEIIMFTPLNEKQIEEIVKIQLNNVMKMLAESGTKLEVTDEALHFLADEGFDPQFGARPVKRAIQRHLLNDLSKELISGNVDNEHPIVVDYENGGLVFKN